MSGYYRKREEKETSKRDRQQHKRLSITGDSIDDESSSGGSGIDSSKTVQRHDLGKERKSRKEKKSIKKKPKKKSKSKSKNQKKRDHHHESDTSSGSDMSLSPPADLLTRDDFFKKNSEFRHWLSESKGKALGECSQSKIGKYFAKFIKRWNAGRLSKKYYDGSASTGHSDKSAKHSWAFTDSITGDERLKIQQTQAINAPKSSETVSHSPLSSNVGPSIQAKPRRAIAQGPALVPDREELNQYQKELAKKEKRDFRRHNDMVLDELVPRETGREARISKRRGVNESRRERSVSPGLSERDLMGNNQDAFKQYITRRREARERHSAKRREKALERISQHEEKEKAMMSALLEMAKATKHENSLWK